MAHSLWWLLPQKLAGTPMPYIHVERRLNHGGGLRDYKDELPEMYDAGIRAVVCLVNSPSDEQVYNKAGIEFLCVPVADFHPPTPDQANEVAAYISDRLAEDKPVAVHCHAGLGRTGTLLAAYLITQGRGAREAINEVRKACPAAIETRGQEEFLENFAESR